MGFCAWSKLYYQQQRSRGKDHHAAVRVLAYKWIRIMFWCWKDRTPYDDSLYVKSLTKRGSHIAEGLNRPRPDSVVEIWATFVNRGLDKNPQMSTTMRFYVQVTDCRCSRGDCQK
jgi:hypothetical protein